MDASLAQSAIVWLALGIGMASVLVCVFSSSAPRQEEGHDAQGSGQEPATGLDAERAG